MSSSVADRPATVQAFERLWLPRPSLGACLRGVLGRSTLGTALPVEQRFNYFPATPLCSLSWMFEGTTEWARGALPQVPERPQAGRLPALSFVGPQSQPTATWNPGPGHGIMVMLMPDAVQPLTGIHVADWVDRVVDAREVLPPDWLPFCDAVFTAPDDEARVRLLQGFLDPRWQACRPPMPKPLPLQARRLHDWAQGLALRAANSTTGRSLRQVERRIKDWTGQPMRELQGLARAERAFFQTMEAQAADSLRWTDVAADSGYADQSHLCRVTRRITGFAPEDLRRRIAEDPAFWVYRLWMGA